MSIDLGGLRCNSDAGALPNLALSAGAYPDQWGTNVNLATQANNNSIGSQSSLLALITLNIPLARAQPDFSCMALLKDAQIKARMDNLRLLVDENVISESQYHQALRALFGPLSGGRQLQEPVRAGGASLAIPPESAPGVPPAPQR